MRNIYEYRKALSDKTNLKDDKNTEVTNKSDAMCQHTHASINPSLNSDDSITDVTSAQAINEHVDANSQPEKTCATMINGHVCANSNVVETKDTYITTPYHVFDTSKVLSGTELSQSDIDDSLMVHSNWPVADNVSSTPCMFERQYTHQSVPNNSRLVLRNKDNDKFAIIHHSVSDTEDTNVNDCILTKGRYKYGNLQLYTVLSNETQNQGVWQTVPKDLETGFIKRLKMFRVPVTGSKLKYCTKLFGIK